MTARRARTTAARRRPAPLGRVGLGLVVALGVVVPSVAGGPAGAVDALPGADLRRSPVVVEQVDPLSPGPYEVGFLDEPLRTNPISAALDDVVAESAELDTVMDAFRATEDRRDAAIVRRDELRAYLVELGEQRIAAVEALAQRQAEERQRGAERAAAVELHERRIEEAEAAARRLEVAQDSLRDVMVAAFVSSSSSLADEFTVLTTGEDVDDALLRLGYSDTSTSGRVADVQRRIRERQAAVEARDAAERARLAAEQAERDAVVIRQQAEQHIVDIDAETTRTQGEEVAAVEALAEREREVLLAAAEVAPARLRADVVGQGIDFPFVALDAWVKAAASAPCRTEWWMLAGISKIEGRHGTHGGGRLGARGFPSTEIIGPQLNGAGAFAEIRDTDGGIWDKDPVFDRAVGPMQFIPSTWARWGRDGDGDGVANPHTVYDAAAAAAAYLCYGRSDLTDEAQLRAAYLSYNQSTVYVNVVLAAARGYQAALPDLPLHVPQDPARPA